MPLSKRWSALNLLSIDIQYAHICKPYWPLGAKSTIMDLKICLGSHSFNRKSIFYSKYFANHLAWKTFLNSAQLNSKSFEYFCDEKNINSLFVAVLLMWRIRYSQPAYLLKVNYRNTRIRCEICSKLTKRHQNAMLESLWCLYCYLLLTLLSFIVHIFF